MAHILISEIIYFYIFSERNKTSRQNRQNFKYFYDVFLQHFWTSNLYNLTFQDFSNSENSLTGLIPMQ